MKAPESTQEVSRVFYDYMPPTPSTPLEIQHLFLNIRARILDENFKNLKHSDFELRDILAQEINELLRSQEIFRARVNATLEKNQILHINTPILKVKSARLNSRPVQISLFSPHFNKPAILLHSPQEFSAPNLNACTITLECIFGLSTPLLADEEILPIENTYQKALMYMVILRILESLTHPQIAQKIALYNELLKKELNFLRALRNSFCVKKTSNFKGIV